VELISGRMMSRRIKKLKQSILTNKFAIELLQEIADYNRKKRSVLKDIREIKWKPRKYNKFQQVISQKKKVEKKTMSWADMCETSDEEEYDENREIVDEKEII
jgi:hypothetical protein